MSIPEVSIEQIKAARALLKWTQADLANASGVSHPTVKRLEMGTGQVGGRRETIEALKSALEHGGVQFILRNGGGAGVRLKSNLG